MCVCVRTAGVSSAVPETCSVCVAKQIFSEKITPSAHHRFLQISCSWGCSAGLSLVLGAIPANVPGIAHADGRERPLSLFPSWNWCASSSPGSRLCLRFVVRLSDPVYLASDSFLLSTANLAAYLKGFLALSCIFFDLGADSVSFP